MSWYRDPQLFIYQFSTVARIRKGFGIPIVSRDLQDPDGGNLNFYKHLSLGNNKESDYDAFKASFPNSGPGPYKFVNCQGLVINWDLVTQTGTWSREPPNSPFWSLPGINKPESAETEQTLEGKVSDLEAKISSLEEENKNIKKEKDAIEAEKAILKAEADRERDEKNARINDLEKQVIDFKSELAADGGKVSDLEAKISSLEEESKRIEKEKQAIEAENAILKAEADRERDEKNALISGFEKQVIDLKSELVMCFNAAGRKVSDLEDKISSLEEESKRIEKEKEVIEEENAKVKAQADCERDEKNAQCMRKCFGLGSKSY